MKIRPLNKREQIICYLVGGVALIAYLVYFAAPRFKQIREAKQRVASSKVEIATSRQMLETLNGQLSSASAELVKNPYYDYLANNRELANVLRLMVESKTLANFQLKRLAAGKVEDYKNFQKADFELEVEATYISMGQFLEALEDSRLLVDVHSVEMQHVGSDLRNVSAKVQLTAYFSRGAG